jgi:hypothetical protein
MRAARRGQAVDDQVDLAEVLLDGLDRDLLDLVGERVAVDARAYRPFSAANFSNAALLYQPAVPGLVSLPARSKNTPSVSAPEPKAAEIRAARP